MESDTKRRPFAEQVLQKATPRHEPEVEEAREAHQDARTRSRECVMLDIRLLDGTVDSFNYAYLTRVKYEPGDTILLVFGRDQVAIEGRNLSRLREIITEHRARLIQEGSDAEEGLKPDDAAHIGKIRITEVYEL